MITKLRWKNCFCFRGEHEISLGAGVFAITASYEDQDGRSNWGGKSSLMKLLGPMPFFGWHGQDLEDNWITEGEDSAFYEVTLDSGARIRRERTRGKSTQILFWEGGRKIGQKGAQREIETHIGLSEPDFFASCFFKQKEIDKLITLRPADRQELVTGWLDLVPLQKCYESVREELSEVSKDVSKYEGLIKESDAAIEQVLTSVGLPDLAAIDLEMAQATVLFDTLSQKAIEAGALVTRVARAAMAVERKVMAEAAILKLDAEWLDLKRERERLDPNSLWNTLKGLAESCSDIEFDMKAASESTTRLFGLLNNKFDGNCPVSPGFVCPAREQILSLKDKHSAEFDVSQAKYKSCREAWETAKKSQASAMKLASRLAEIDAQLASVEREIIRYRKDAEVDVPELPTFDPTAEANRLNREVGQLQSRIWALGKVKKELEAHVCTLTERKDRYTKLQDERTRLAEAAAVFKLAQTKCAEDGLAEIEEGANDLLSDAEIDLSVKIAWQRETHGLAKHCDVCGAGFPVSTKVKSCTTCNAPRGNHFVEKLLVKLSDTSGGAEDLGGLSLQLSAAHWLRSKRGSSFDIVYLDEVAGALDAANRKSLGKHISNMITGRFGFRQGFVVSHSPDIDAMFQGRIEIVVKKDGTRTVAVV